MSSESANDHPETVNAEWADVFEAVEHCYRLGWTDGLPVVPPADFRVAQFLDTVGLPASEVIGQLPERRREITCGVVAANAVMAGCLPEYMPVVLAAARAMLAPDFNLVGPSSSLGGAAVLVIVNGPVAAQLDINARNNLFGPGNRANATIGRAIRLILMNACAAVPGLFDRSVIGHPGKYTYCIAEAEADTHWNPLHVERGLTAHDSAVTLFAGEAPRQVRAIGDPEAILFSIADTAATLGTSLSTGGSVGDRSAGVRQGEIVVTIAGDSALWRDWTKAQVRDYLHSRLRRSVADLKRARVIPGDVEPGDDARLVDLVAEPDDILVVFAGGEEANMSSVIPSWGPKVSSTAVTRPIPPRTG